MPSIEVFESHAGSLGGQVLHPTDESNGDDNFLFAILVLQSPPLPALAHTPPARSALFRLHERDGCRAPASEPWHQQFRQKT